MLTAGRADCGGEMRLVSAFVVGEEGWVDEEEDVKTANAAVL